MAYVSLKCPSYGGLDNKNGMFKCQNCGSTILNIVEPVSIDGIDTISLEEFKKKIDESTRQLIVNFDDSIEVFDADKLIVNKKIKDAVDEFEKLVKEISYNYQVDLFYHKLLDLPQNNIIIARLKFLLLLGVSNEYELMQVGKIHSHYKSLFIEDYDHSQYAKEIENFKQVDLKKSIVFNNLLNLCNEEQKQFYNDVIDMAEKKTKIIEEINKCWELKKINLHSESIKYAEQMCKKYPTISLSWINYLILENKLNGKHIKKSETCAKSCSDYQFLKENNKYTIDFEAKKNKLKKINYSIILGITILIILTICSIIFGIKNTMEFFAIIVICILLIFFCMACSNIDYDDD